MQSYQITVNQSKVWIDRSDMSLLSKTRHRSDDLHLSHHAMNDRRIAWKLDAYIDTVKSAIERKQKIDDRPRHDGHAEEERLKTWYDWDLRSSSIYYQSRILTTLTSILTTVQGSFSPCMLLSGTSVLNRLIPVLAILSAGFLTMPLWDLPSGYERVEISSGSSRYHEHCC